MLRPISPPDLKPAGSWAESNYCQISDRIKQQWSLITSSKEALGTKWLKVWIFRRRSMRLSVAWLGAFGSFSSGIVPDRYPLSVSSFSWETKEKKLMKKLGTTIGTVSMTFQLPVHSHKQKLTGMLMIVIINDSVLCSYAYASVQVLFNFFVTYFWL